MLCRNTQLAVRTTKIAKGGRHLRASYTNCSIYLANVGITMLHVPHEWTPYAVEGLRKLTFVTLLAL